MLSEAEAGEVEGVGGDILGFVRERFFENIEHGFEDPSTGASRRGVRAMYPNVIDVERVPLTPVFTNDVVEGVDKVSVPVHRHVGDALGTAQVLVILAVELYNNELTGFFVEGTRVKGIFEVELKENFRAQRDTHTHVELGRTRVEVVERGVFAGGVESTAISE